jgi:uncharacterized membrane protein YvbJ
MQEFEMKKIIIFMGLVIFGMVLCHITTGTKSEQSNLDHSIDSMMVIINNDIKYCKQLLELKQKEIDIKKENKTNLTI